MKKQPLLTGFPRTVFATCARRHQADIRRRRDELLSSSPGGYSVMFEDVLPGSFLADSDATDRQRHFGNIPVFWAWCGQILEQNASCSKALSFIQTWCVNNRLPTPASDTGAYCRGRKRLGEKFLGPVCGKVLDTLERRGGGDCLWNGFTVKAVDGSSTKLTDTAANQREYPQPSSQKTGCGFPVMGVSALLNLSHGGWEAFHTTEHTTHDLEACEPFIKQVGAGDLLLADRAYCSYRLIHKLLGNGGHAVIRLHQARERALDWRKGKRISPYERLVTWKRPAYVKNGKMTRQEWELLPEMLELRLIRLGCEDRQGKKRNITVVTTLTDAQAYDGVELHALYSRRWDIELRLRDIKTTLGFEFIRARTPEMAHKTLAMIQIAYNLLRVLMQRAERETGGAAGSVSFKGVLDLASSMRDTVARLAGQPRNRKRFMDMIVELSLSRTVAERPFRREPRAVKIRPKPFPLLTSPRHEYVEIQHRSNYRKSA